MIKSVLPRRRGRLGRRFSAGVLAFGLVLTVSGTASTQTLPPAVEVDVGIIGVSSSIWPAIVAEKKGFFAAEGLHVSFVSVGASARVAQQVAAGSLSIGSSSFVDTVRAIDGGGSVKIFLNSQAVGT